MDELEQLRTQVAAFKSRLDEQEIVNDRLMRDVVRGKVKSLRSLNITVYILGAFGYLVLAAVLLAAGVSVWPVVLLGLLFVGECVFSFWNLHTISGIHQMSVLDAQTAMTAFVRREKWLNILELPVVIAIVVWAWQTYEGGVTALDSVPSDLVSSALCGGIVGCIIGVAFVAWLFCKQFRMIGNIRRSIAALRSEEAE